MKEERCPELIVKRVGDEGIYFCRETDRASGMKQCWKEYGWECETYNEIMEEKKCQP